MTHVMDMIQLKDVEDENEIQKIKDFVSDRGFKNMIFELDEEFPRLLIYNSHVSTWVWNGDYLVYNHEANELHSTVDVEKRADSWVDEEYDPTLSQKEKTDWMDKRVGQYLRVVGDIMGYNEIVEILEVVDKIEDEENRESNLKTAKNLGDKIMINNDDIYHIDSDGAFKIKKVSDMLEEKHGFAKGKDD